MRKLLVTGGCGFAGHHFVEHVLRTTDWDVIVLDSLTYAGRVDRLTDVEKFDPHRVSIMWHDLRAPLSNSPLLDDITAVVHLAAESHVDRSIMHPAPFIHNNVMATLNLLEWARHHTELTHFIQISTDEVYGPAASDHRHREWESMLPSNPYSASKVAQEALAISYWRTYRLPVVITNTMNLFGERQDPEKFVAKVVRAVIEGWSVPLHARKVDGRWEPSSRHWLHARNHADALCWLLEHPVTRYGDGADRPDRWNVAGEEHNVLEMLDIIAGTLLMQPRYEFVDYHSSRPGHDHRYALDPGKLARAGWTPPYPLEESLITTVRWMVAHAEWLR